MRLRSLGEAWPVLGLLALAIVGPLLFGAFIAPIKSAANEFFRPPAPIFLTNEETKTLLYGYRAELTEATARALEATEHTTVTVKRIIKTSGPP